MLSTYIVDNYFEYAMEVIMLYSMVINVSSTAGVLDGAGGLAQPINPWFISLWVEESGTR